MRGWVRHGDAVLHDLGARLDDLHRATRTQVTARRPWLQSWIDTNPDWTPVAIGVDAPDGSLAAVALLATRRQGPLRRLVLLGHGPSDVLALPARDAVAAEALADQVASYLHGLRRPWHLLARHLETPRTGGGSSPVLAATARRVRSRVVPGDPSPVLVADRGPALDDYVTGSHRRGISRLHNRMGREGLVADITHVESTEAVAATMAEVERVMRARDADVGRVSPVDIPPERDFLRLVVARHAAVGQLRLTCVHLDGVLAAYVVCFLDDDVVRMWNTRFDPSFSRYSPGKVAMDASVREALRRGARAYDFMRGAEPYKDSYASGQEVATDLSASSGRVVHLTEAVLLWGRDRHRRAATSSSLYSRGIDRARSALARR